MSRYYLKGNGFAVPFESTIASNEEVSMAKIFLCSLIVLAGVNNFLPVIGVFSADNVKVAYGLTLLDPTVEILLRHRAVLFGLIGGFMIYAAFRPDLHYFAIIGGLISMLSFMVLFWSVGGDTTALKPLLYADIAATIFLGIALSMKSFMRV